MKENIGKKIRIFFYDSPTHVTNKTGTLISFDSSLVVIMTNNIQEAIPLDKIVRMEVLNNG